MKSYKDNPPEVEIPPQVQKKQEYLLLVDYVRAGAWRNNTWLASILGVNDETVTEWKKTAPVMEARKEAIKGLLKDFEKKGDVEKRLAETGFEVEPSRIDLSTKGQPIMGAITVSTPNDIPTDNSN